jgi:hypothetical protein
LRFAHYNSQKSPPGDFLPCKLQAALAAAPLIVDFFAFFLKDCKKIHKRNGC